MSEHIPFLRNRDVLRSTDRGWRAGADKKPRIVGDREPLCVAPPDLYSLHARDRIGRLLEGWLARNRATPFKVSMS